ncbi:MAG: GNAT family N-acetyltransferase [Crocinitomicaceae bacterium]|nr:GNAT family N-acetyltransferase [Flavobacteriales bacterium]NQZ35362.1 GNAT family N-acetyltransferase [Crocinitomicaceae bacterium]PHR26870.1 MAG: GNAT family N-acetyltransferase [Fluviicola sp.]
MEIRELTSKEEMLKCFDILCEVYDTLTLEEYDRELDLMLPHNYGQVVVMDGETIAGLTGYWIGSKLWCGKYLELDNVVVSDSYRSKGIGKMLFDFMEQRAEKEKCTMLSLDSYSTNFKAHKFFYSQGFVPRGFHFINILDKSKVR